MSAAIIENVAYVTPLKYAATSMLCGPSNQSDNTIIIFFFQIGDKGVVAVAKALAGNTTMRKLILEMTGVGNKAAVALADVL